MITPQQREDLQRVRRSQHVLLRLVEDVLSFACVDAGRLEYRFEKVRVDDVLDGIEALSRTAIARQGTVVHVRARRS